MRLQIAVTVLTLLLFAAPVFAQDADVDDIVFARDIQLNTIAPIQASDVFPETQTVVYAIVYMEDFPEGDEVEFIWYRDGDLQDSLVLANNSDDDSPVLWSSWSNPDGIEEGEWSLEIYYDDEIIGEGEFEITDDDYVYPIIFAEGCGRSTGQLFGVNTVFEDATFLYAYVEYANFSSEDVEIVWQLDGDDLDMNEIIVEFDFDDDRDDNWYCFWIQNPDGLPEGDYSLRLLDDDQDEIFQSETVEIEN